MKERWQGQWEEDKMGEIVLWASLESGKYEENNENSKRGQ